MLIALEKKKSNVAEYLLYMWQLEDLFRAQQLDEASLYNLLISPLEVEPTKKAEIWNWYKIILREIISQDIRESGHRAEITEIMNELSYLHKTLVSITKDPKYIDLYSKAKPHLELLKSKSGEANQEDIKTSLSALYGILLLRLKKKEISEETKAAMDLISKMIAYLAASYHKINNVES